MLLAKENGVLFDEKKTELLYLSKRKYVEPPLRIDQTSISAKEKLKQLGTLLDKKLSSKGQIQKLCQQSWVGIDHV